MEREKSWFKGAGFLVGILIMFFSKVDPLIAGGKKADAEALARETLQVEMTASGATLVWWTPKELWKAILEEEPDISKSEVKQALKVLDPYLIVMVSHSEIKDPWSVKYRSQKVMRDGLKVVDRDGNEYSPLNEKKIDSYAEEFLHMAKPFFAEVLWIEEEEAHFFLFPSKDKKGRSMIDNKRKGKFLVKLDSQEFKWRLPLSSTLQSKYCPIDEEKLNGNWEFCPWHGTKLKDK